jgi:hypothetical protein
MPVADRSSKITIAMPVFNGGNYFRLALQSALSQTHQNIEIVVVDDGSTDGGETEAIAKTADSGRVRYIRQPNRGVAGALNTAIRTATGDFFCWLSHDDIFVPHKIERQIEFHARLGRSNAVLFSNYDQIDEDGAVIFRVRLDAGTLLKSSQWSLMRAFINGCTIFIPMWALRAHGPFDESLRYVQDYDMWNRILETCDMFLQSESLVQYRIHSAQGTLLPGAVCEGDDLWVRLIESRSSVERALMSGSDFRFLSSMTSFLGSTQYKKAANFARGASESIVRNTRVSVFLPVVKNDDQVLAAASSALSQTHGTLEVVLICPVSLDMPASVEALPDQDPRFRIERVPSRLVPDMLNIIARKAAGDYVAVLDSATCFAPTKIELQVAAMQEHGAWVSVTRYSGRPLSRYMPPGVAAGERSMGGALVPSTLMVHRAVIAGGFVLPDPAIPLNRRAWADLIGRHRVHSIEQQLSYAAPPRGNSGIPGQEQH